MASSPVAPPAPIWPWNDRSRPSCARRSAPVLWPPPTTSATVAWRWRRRNAASALVWGPGWSCPPPRSVADRLLFAEGGGRILVSVPPDQEPAWREALAAEKGFGGDAAVMGQRLGVVQDAATLTLLLGGSPLLRVPLEQLRQTYEQALPRRMDRGGAPPDH